MGGRKGIRPVKTEWWDADVVMRLGQGADLHMAQLMPLQLTLAPVNPDWFYFPGFTFLMPATTTTIHGLWILSGTTRVSRYQKKHSPTHTYHGHQSSSA